ncbi:hypothetical protein BGZ95_001261 [Linnemannia exigua]|uniref:Uncharacterized protein n=1 Tax=Linnemannia exigua TaxID=604196 RepID=A0AAD4D752_9FUNG|nr:hypothetical protein BGZ95_001261 [Linnemannia exigua]
MPTWPRSNGSSEKPAKVKKEKTPKPPKAPKPPPPEIVIMMPGRRKKEFGMGTFGTEPMDTIASPPLPSTEPEAELEQLTNSLSELTPTSAAHNSNNTSISKSNGNDSNGDINDNNVHLLRDQLSPSFKTPGTPATPGSMGLMTPHSNRTSYFPTTPASGNTISTTTSAHSTSTAAFGNSQHEGGTSKNINSSSNSYPPIDTPQASTPTAALIAPSASATTTPGPVVPETTKRSRHLRSDIPPAIVTRAHILPSSSSPAHFHNNNIYQTPSTPRMPSAFSNSMHDLPSSYSASDHYGCDTQNPRLYE